MAGQIGGEDRAIHAEPTKDFFVTMLTRDISLFDCILDLLDNSVDAARRQQARAEAPNLQGFTIRIELNQDSFRIADNCGGISLAEAINHAFHFGKRRDAPAEVAAGIGIYGIGMKRAIFKLGRLATVQSQTGTDSFVVTVDVDEWELRDEWDFEYDDREREGANGTRIEVLRLCPGVGASLADPVFANQLIALVARDYSFFLAKGLAITVNDRAVPNLNYELRRSAELVPATVAYEDDGVQVRIVAGLMDTLPDDIPEDLRPNDVARYGWFVVCNDRVVLAGNKDHRTVWGSDGFKVWHPQYNGFAGLLFMASDDPKNLPWTTTKREIDLENGPYRRALARMKDLTAAFIDYTNRRKADLERARAAEAQAVAVNVAALRDNVAAVFPVIVPDARPRVRYVTISYAKPLEEIVEIARHMGQPGKSAREVGRTTFEYYRKAEMGK